MNLDLGNAWDSIKDGTKEVTEVAHAKTSEFHESYVSKVLPDCGKYGDAAKFAAEMVPGVSEYNAIVDGDWTAFAIAAGIDIGAIAIGAFTAGAGYAAVKGGSTVAKTGAKVAVKEVAEAGAKKVVKEVAEEGAEKVVKEAAEAGAKKAVKEVAEESVEKVVKETVETGAKKAVKEVTEEGAEKVVKEMTEDLSKKTAKEVADAVDNPEVLDKVEQIVKNKMDGIAREEKVLEELLEKHMDDGAKVIREAYLRDANGNIIKDAVEGTARRIDYVVSKGGKVIESIEVTSESASKTLQMAKESRILEEAWKNGGAFIKDPDTGMLIEFGKEISTMIRRLQ